jgi:LysR family nitrogen assimilation transcriptional regulator
MARKRLQDSAAMDLKQLRLFRGVVEAGSFTKAAEFLYIAQPALGLQIQHLEKELGVALLIRHSRGVTPTEAGELLYRRAEALLRHFEQVKQDLVDFAKAPHGRVCLGLTPTATMSLAAELIETCKRRYPGVTVTLVEGLSEMLTPWLEADRVDVALTYNPMRRTGLSLEALAEEALYLISPSDAGEGGSSVTFAEAVRENLVLTTGLHGLRAIVEEAARANDVALSIVCEANSVSALKDLVRRGFGHTVLPYGAVRGEVQAGAVIARKLVEPEFRRTLYLAVSARRPVSKAAEAVCREIRQAVARLAASGAVDWKLRPAEASKAAE